MSPPSEFHLSPCRAPFCPSLTLCLDTHRNTHTHAYTQTAFVLITDGETKTACVGNQSCCQPGSCGARHHLRRVCRRGANVRCEQNVYLSGISSGSLHTQHNAISILPLEAKQTHTHTDTHFFFVLFLQHWSLWKCWKCFSFLVVDVCCLLISSEMCTETRFLLFKKASSSFYFVYILKNHPLLDFFLFFVKS